MSPPENVIDATKRAASIEIAMAILVAVLFSLSPLSSGSRPMISVAMGCFFGVVFFAYRWLSSRAVVQEMPRSAIPATDATVKRSMIFILPGLVLALYLPTLIELYPWFTESVWRNGHGLFLPLLIFAVTRVALRNLGGAKIAGSGLGFAFLIPGLLLTIADSGVHSIYLAVLGMPLVVAGLILIFLGPTWARALAVPTGMLLFFIPFSSGLATILGFDVASATCAQWVLDLMGRSVFRDGATLLVESHRGYGISARCSGFSILYGALALSVALGAVTRSWRRSLLLGICAVPLTLFANGARVALLIVVCEWRGLDPSQTMLHGVSGIVAYLGVIAAMFVMGGRAARLRLVAQ